jgi:hypothetical protein
MIVEATVACMILAIILLSDCTDIQHIGHIQNDRQCTQ